MPNDIISTISNWIITLGAIAGALMAIYKIIYTMVTKNKNIIFAGGSTSDLDPGSATNLKTYSLKASQFSTKVDYEGIYDNVLDFRIRDYLDSKSNLGLDYKGNYYLPIYIDVAYTNNSKCKTLTDSEAKSTKYNNYVKVN